MLYIKQKKVFQDDLKIFKKENFYFFKKNFLSSEKHINYSNIEYVTNKDPNNIFDDDFSLFVDHKNKKNLIEQKKVYVCNDHPISFDISPQPHLIYFLDYCPEYEDILE